MATIAERESHQVYIALLSLEQEGYERMELDRRAYEDSYTIEMLLSVCSPELLAFQELTVANLG